MSNSDRTTLLSERAASLDLGEARDREHLVDLLRERRQGVIADLIALAEVPPGLISAEGRVELQIAHCAELALCEEILTGLGEDL